MPSTWGQRQQYGEFRIVGAAEGRPRLLGEGSFGKTFEAVRSESVAGNVIEESVALKVLNPDLLNSASKRIQFVQERTALTRLKHANLIHSIKCGEDNGEVYFAMELCRGGDLARLVKRFGALPERVAALIGMQAAIGLREMHRREMVHRDIKPPNVMLFEELPPGCTLDDLTLLLEENESLCRIVDFGLVGTILNAPGGGGHAAHQKFVGSMMYASPEQILERKNIDGRTDIYALGMTLWYLVQGRGPLLDARGDELKHAIEAEGRHLSSGEHEADLPNNLSHEFREILARMVAKRPEERMPNAKELAVALERYLERSARVRSVGLPPVQSRERLQSFFTFKADALKSIGRQRFAAEHSSTKQKARLTIVEDLDDIGKIRPDFTDVVKKVCDLAQNLHRPDVPATLLPVQEVVWAADALAYAEDEPGDVTLAEVLQVRTATKRPFSFREAEVIFRPIAEALDFLINHGWDLISLPCEDVWLSDPAAAAAANDRKVLCRPLDEWPGLRVSFSGMWVPPEKGKAPGAAISFASSSQGGSSFMTVESLRPPVSAFLRLVYRTLSGSDVPDAADRWQNGYIPSVSLQNSSNNLIRDLLCKQREWPSVSLILNELCANEGVSVDVPVIPSPERGGSRIKSGTTRATAGSKATATPVAATPAASTGTAKPSSHGSSGSTAGRPPSTDANEDGPSPREARTATACEIVSVGVVRMGDYIKELSPLDWVSKEFVKCEETGTWFFFPAEGRGLFEGRVERLKFVFSPYSNAEQEVDWSYWSPGREIICATTHQPFLLPQDLPFPVGRLPDEGTGRIINYFAPHGAPISVAPSDWVPGGQITCPTTHNVFVLPEHLPHLEATVEVRKAGWVSSPYEPEAAWTIPPAEWFAGQEIICNATRKPLTLPREVEQWVAEAVVIDAAAREVQSPYHKAARCVIPAMEWRRGGSVKCPPAGRPARLPMDLPPLVGQVVPGVPGFIRSPFSQDKITVPFPNWITGREMVCPKSGQPFLLPPGLPIPDGSVLQDKPGLAFSPYDPTQTVKVDPLHWVTGEVLTCPATGERFKLPEKLPPMHAIVTSGDPGLVRSPFAPQTSAESEVNCEIRVPIEDWVAGNAFECPVTKHIFALPPDIEEWIKDGAWVTGAPGRVRSPFRNGGEIDLTADQWKPGALVTCPVARRRFRAPITEGFPSLALEKAAVQRAQSEPEADEEAALAVLKKDHPGASAAAIAAIWTRHHLETVEKRLPKEFGLLIEGEPGFVTSPYNQKRMAVPAETWVQAGASVLCETGKRFLLPPDRPHLIGTVAASKPGIVASPFAPDKPVQVKPWQWRAGMEIICEHSGHTFALPAALPTWVPQAVLDARKLGCVINPFSPAAESIPVSGQDWLPENILSVEGRQYKLPKELPPLVASLEKTVRGKAESPYAPGTIIAVNPDLWTPGQAVICTKTKREFFLPASLPDDPFEGIDPHDDGTIQSPYGKGGRFKMLALEWLGEGVVRCPETGKRIVLPTALPLLFGTVDPDRPCEVRSPFDISAWSRLAIEDWTEGRDVTCAQTHRTFRLPKEPLPLPFAELAPGKPGAVRSPFRNGAEILVPPVQWIEGGEVEDRTAKRRFRLPKSGLPLLEGIPVAGRSLVVKSPFDPKAEVAVPLADWTPGHEVTCPATSRVFVLPRHLDEPALPARLIDGRTGWIIDPYTNQELEVPGPEWNENGTLISAEGRKIVLPGKLPPLFARLVFDSPLRIQSPYDAQVLEDVPPRKWIAGSVVKCGKRTVQLPHDLPPPPGGVATKSAFPLAALTGITACLLLAGGAAWYVYGHRDQTPIVGQTAVPGAMAPEKQEPAVPVPQVPVTPVPVSPPTLIAAAQSIDKKNPDGKVTDEALSAYLAAYKDFPAEAGDWLLSNVARLTAALFEKAHQKLNPEDRGRLISAGKKSDAANKEVAATSWYLDAGQQRETKGDKDIGVLTAYREAATRSHVKAADWLYANVTAKPVPNAQHQVYDPYSSDPKPIDILPKDWKPGQVIKEKFLKLSNELPPLIAKLDSAKPPDGDKKGLISDPYDPGTVIEVDRKEWYRGALLQPDNIALPNDLPLMEAKIDPALFVREGDRTTARIASPVTGELIPISWKNWAPGQEITETIGQTAVAVAVLAPNKAPAEMDPKLPALHATLVSGPRGKDQPPVVTCTAGSPYSGEVRLALKDWVRGAPVQDPGFQTEGKGPILSFTLPATLDPIPGVLKDNIFAYSEDSGVLGSISLKDKAFADFQNVTDFMHNGQVFRIISSLYFYVEERGWQGVDPRRGTRLLKSEVETLKHQRSAESERLATVVEFSGDFNRLIQGEDLQAKKMQELAAAKEKMEAEKKMAAAKPPPDPNAPPEKKMAATDLKPPPGPGIPPAKQVPPPVTMPPPRPVTQPKVASENTIPKDRRSSFTAQNGVYMSYEKKDGGYWISKKGTGLSGFVFGKERAAKSGSNWDEVCNLMTTRARAAGQIPQNYRIVPAGEDRVKAVRE